MAALGVTSIDMPKAPMVLTNGIKYLVNLPELRKLNRRVDDSGQPIRKLLKDPAVVRAAYLQTRGKEAAKLCTFYEKGRGPWQSCVVFDGNDKNDFGTCANCRFSKHKHACTLYTEEKPESKTVTLWIRNNAAVENDAGRTPRSGLYSMAAASFQNDLGVSFNTDAEGRRSKPHVAGREAPLSRKRKASHPSPSPGPVEHKRSRHDGKVVVPFPLEPEDFNDLDLLKSAAKDMTVHLQVVKTRIKDIEDQKRSEEKKINPWDLV